MSSQYVRANHGVSLIERTYSQLWIKGKGKVLKRPPAQPGGLTQGKNMTWRVVPPSGFSQSHGL